MARSEHHEPEAEGQAEDSTPADRYSSRATGPLLVPLKAELIQRDPLADEILDYVLAAARERAAHDPEGLPAQIARATWQLMGKHV